jgi:hypothetical protein
MFRIWCAGATCWLALCVTACSSTEDDSVPVAGVGSIDGAVGGNGVTVHGAAAVKFNSDTVKALIILSEDPAPCERVKQVADWKDAVSEGKDPLIPGSTSLWMALVSLDGTDPSTGPNDAWVGFEQSDASCNFSLPPEARRGSGTVTLTQLDLAPGGHTKGTLQAVVGQQQDSVSASFDAPFCVQLDFTTSGARPPGCP